MSVLFQVIVRSKEFIFCKDWRSFDKEVSAMLWVLIVSFLWKKPEECPLYPPLLATSALRPFLLSLLWRGCFSYTWVNNRNLQTSHLRTTNLILSHFKWKAEIACNKDVMCFDSCPIFIVILKIHEHLNFTSPSYINKLRFF